jgi:hypothetical protein
MNTEFWRMTEHDRLKFNNPAWVAGQIYEALTPEYSYAFNKLLVAVNPFQTNTASILARANEAKAIASQSAISMTDADLGLSLRCMRMTLPGRDIEPAIVELYGHKLRYAATSSFSGSFPVTFYEDRTLFISRVVGLWQDICKNHYGQIGHMKYAAGTGNPLQKTANIVKGVNKGYAVDAEVYVYDNIGNVAATFALRGVWPMTVSEFAFDSNATALTTDVTFSYDVCEEVIE